MGNVCDLSYHIRAVIAGARWGGPQILETATFQGIFMKCRACRWWCVKKKSFSGWHFRGWKHFVNERVRGGWADMLKPAGWLQVWKCEGPRCTRNGLRYLVESMLRIIQDVLLEKENPTWYLSDVPDLTVSIHNGASGTNSHTQMHQDFLEVFNWQKSQHSVIAFSCFFFFVFCAN